MADFTALKTYMDNLHKKGGIPGCDVIVYHKGQPVFRHMAGCADHARTRSIDEHTLYNMYSCTKPVTATAAMQLVEQGKLELDAPVSRYLPEYADAFVIEDGRRVTVGDTMTVRHLFTMTAGLTYNMTTPSIRAVREQNPQATTRQMAAAFVREPLTFRPGQRFQYSLCHDALAAVVEVVSGMRFGDYLQQHIFTPLGMTDIGFFPTEEQMSRVADQYLVADKQEIESLREAYDDPFLPEPDGERALILMNDKTVGVFRLSGQYESGGAGLVSCTEAYGRFVAAMSCGGTAADGTRILRPETVDLMHTEQLSSFEGIGVYGCAVAPGYGYGLGVRTLIDKSIGARSSLGEFGWNGAAGSYILMDPATQVGIVYAMHVRNWPAMFHGTHDPVRDLTYKALGL